MSKVIVITGAGAGLGRALAQRFAAEGERVVLIGRTRSKVEALAAELGGDTLALGCDVSSPHEVRAAFDEIAARFPAIDVLVNNAAVYEPFAVEDATDEQILSSVATNLIAPMLCARGAIPLMRRGSHIINVSSQGVELMFPMLSVYQASKAGVEHFSNALYRELDPRGIRVSCVRAGAMYGEGTSWDLPPNVAARFHAECLAAGLDLRQRGATRYESVTQVFRSLIDMPDDLHAVSVALFARKP